MSSDDWRERIRRFQGNDLLITLVVIVCLIALVIYEVATLVNGHGVKFNADGPIPRILLGVLAAFTFFKTRQTHKDVVQDVGATTELRETVDQKVAPAIRDATARLDGDIAAVIKALESQHLSTVQKIMEDRRVERHDLRGELNAAQLLLQEARHESQSLREKVGMLEGLLAGKGKQPEC